MKLSDYIMKRIENALRDIKPEEINGGNRCPTYLYRWELLSLLGGRVRVYLHKFVGDDWALDLHDHPKKFWSIGLAGEYTEVTTCDDPAMLEHRHWRAPWVRSFPAEHRHRLVGPTEEKPCWTLVVVGAPVRIWGFWGEGGFIPWQDYVKPGSGARTSCSEPDPEPCRHPAISLSRGDEFSPDRCTACGDILWPPSPRSGEAP